MILDPQGLLDLVAGSCSSAHNSTTLRIGCIDQLTLETIQGYMYRDMVSLIENGVYDSEEFTLISGLHVIFLTQDNPNLWTPTSDRQLIQHYSTFTWSDAPAVGYYYPTLKGLLVGGRLGSLPLLR